MLARLNCPDQAGIQLFQFPDTIHVFSVRTQFTCFVSRDDPRVLCPDTIPGFCVQTRFTCFVSSHDSPVQLSRQGADHGYPNMF